jgi:hypothetical protein
MVDGGGCGGCGGFINYMDKNKNKILFLKNNF